MVYPGRVMGSCRVREGSLGRFKLSLIEISLSFFGLVGFRIIPQAQYKGPDRIWDFTIYSKLNYLNIIVGEKIFGLCSHTQVLHSRPLYNK